MTGAAAQALARGIATEFRRRLLDEYVPRIGRCLQLLDDDAVWRRPAPNCNSVGNLLLHLRGNVTQWILCGLGGQADDRDRDAEFAAEGSPGTDRHALHRALADAAQRACDVVDAAPVTALLAEHTFQGRYRETGLAAVLHVLEHFSGHAGQIYAWTKQVTGADLAFYDL